MAKGMFPDSAVGSASGFLCKAAGDFMSQLLGSYLRGSLVGELTGSEALGITAVPQRSPRYPTALKETQ